MIIRINMIFYAEPTKTDYHKLARLLCLTLGSSVVVTR